MPCAPGTAFNPSIGVCDYPYNVPGCGDEGGSSNSTEASTEKTPELTFPPPPPSPPPPPPPLATTAAASSTTTAENTIDGENIDVYQSCDLREKVVSR